MLRKSGKTLQIYPLLQVQIGIPGLYLVIKNISKLYGVRNYAKFNMKSLLLSKTMLIYLPPCYIVFMIDYGVFRL